MHVATAATARKVSWSKNDRDARPATQAGLETENNVQMLPFRRAGVLSEFMQLKYFFCFVFQQPSCFGLLPMRSRRKIKQTYEVMSTIPNYVDTLHDVIYTHWKAQHGSADGRVFATFKSRV